MSEISLAMIEKLLEPEKDRGRSVSFFFGTVIGVSGSTLVVETKSGGTIYAKNYVYCDVGDLVACIAFGTTIIAFAAKDAQRISDDLSKAGLVYSAGDGITIDENNKINADVVESDITQLSTQIAGKAAATHTHSAADTTSGVFDLERIPTIPSTKLSGTIPLDMLPSFVDDVIEHETKAAFPTTGETGKIYVDTSTNRTYRWGGSAYVEISASLALGETSSTAYRGDRGKAAYEHSLRTDNPHGVTPSQIGAAATEHGHDASDIDGGTLSSDRLPTVPVVKGGTGAAMAADGYYNLYRRTGNGSQDWNTYTDPGIYVTNSLSGDNAPPAAYAYGYLEVWKASANVIMQRFTTHRSEVFYRQTYVGDFSNSQDLWRKIYADADVISVANGGTGGKTVNAARYNLLGSVWSSPNAMTNAWSLLMHHGVNATSENGALFRIPASTLWTYIHGKITDGGITASDISAAASDHNHDDMYQPKGEYAEADHGHGVATDAEAGFMPVLGGGTTNYLRADGSWAKPPNTTYGAATTSAAGLMSAADKSKLDGIVEGANKTTVDTALSATSTNPVQNKVIKGELDAKAAVMHTHSYQFNGSTNTAPAWFAPLSSGTAGQYLVSSGSGAPTWATIEGGVVFMPNGYPQDSVYLTYDPDFNPADAFGGTWTKDTQTYLFLGITIWRCLAAPNQYFSPLDMYPIGTAFLTYDKAHNPAAEIGGIWTLEEQTYMFLGIKIYRRVE